ncbi:MAG: serine/threonine-protein kinase [Myxococcota bacterium]
MGQPFADDYRIVRLIARGASARVYLAEHRPTGRTVALKILAPSLAGGRPDRFRERFLREAAQLARLSHPNTVRVYDHGIGDDQPYIAMEYVEGPTLQALVADGRLDPVRAVRIARQICGSLGEAHDLGLVHRDLKPANVLVTRAPAGGNAYGDDLVKLVDFGLVAETEDAVHTTSEGLMVGTPMYMAPEQIRGRSLDQRCDIYALGVVLYRALTGAYPFAEGLPAPVLMSHLTDLPAPFVAVAPEMSLPPCVEWTVMRCLEKDRDARFANVRELLRALKLCEAALLDESTASLTQLRLVDGHVVLPEAIYGRTPVPRMPGAGGWLQHGLVVIGVATCLALAAVFGFVVVRGLLAAAHTSGIARPERSGVEVRAEATLPPSPLSTLPTPGRAAPTEPPKPRVPERAQRDDLIGVR